MKLNCNYVSKALGRAVEIIIALPSPVYPEVLGYGAAPEFSPKQKFPSLLLLGGIGNDCNSVFDYTRAQLYAEEYNIAIVSVSGENKFYADNSGDRFSEFIEEELPALLSGYFPVSSDPRDRYIAGLSMGGYGAMLHFLKRPDLYGGVGCFSGAVGKFEYAETEAGKDYNVYRLLKERVKGGKLKGYVYLSCGKEDFIRDCSLKLKDCLKENNVPFDWHEAEGLGHEWRFWDGEIERFIEQLPRKDAYANKRRKV